MNDKIEFGFYWVYLNEHTGWEVAEFAEDGWHVCGVSDTYAMSAFERVSTTPLTPPGTPT